MTGPHPDPLDWRQNLEPPADAASLDPIEPQDRAAISIAISLKRIADAVAAVQDVDRLGFLTNLAWDMGRNLGHGFEQGRR